MRLFGFIKFVASVFLFGSLTYGGYYIIDKYVWNAFKPEMSAEEEFIKEVDKITNIEHFQDDKSLDTKNNFVILLLGVDSNSFESTRSDTIILGLVEPKNQKISLLSLPRDLRVDIPGKSSPDKINSAYAVGGVGLTAKTIENLLDVPIEYYATINFKGFEELVDAIGGLEIDVEKDLTFSDRITKTQFSLNEGTQTLNGIETLNYARFRGDAEGDYGRMRRQKQVITELIDQTITFRNVPKMISLIDVVDDNFQSNVNYKDLGLLAIKMRSTSKENIQNIEFTSEPSMIDGVSYVVSSEEELNNLSLKLKEILND